MALVVQKFGGTSVADAQKIKAAAQKAGLLVGAYYYATPTSSHARVVSDARSQARKAARRVGGQLPDGHLPLALDLETTATALGKSDLTKWAVTWLKVVEKRTGRKPWFYSYTTYMEKRMLPDPELQSYPLWHANWGLFLKDKPMTIKAVSLEEATAEWEKTKEPIN